MAVGVGVGVWAVTRDDGTGANGSGHHVRTELLAQARPRPSCPNAPAAPRVATGQTELSVLRIVDHCLAYRSEVVATGDVTRRLAALRADPGVVAADVATTRPAPPSRTTATTEPVKQWALGDLKADEVRKLWPAGADVKVAIVDTGVDDHNLDLAGQVAEHAPWARIDHGKDEKHGTHVAGIVAAKDDGDGALGLTPAAKLIDAQRSTANREWAGPAHDEGEYLRWAIDHGADVLNMSFGGLELPDTEVAALIYAEQTGVVAVGSAGNCGSILYKLEGCTKRNPVEFPGAYDTVLTVAAHNDDHGHPNWSTKNASVDLAAPGDDIESDCPTFGKHEYKTCSDQGTSMAAPYVSAAAALLRARHPEASPAAIREALIRNTRPVDEHHPAGVHSDEFGTGLLDPVAAAHYLDQHAGQTTPTASASSASPEAVGPDTIVAGIITAEQHNFRLVTADATMIPVVGVKAGETPSALAFSRDGAWFAASDGHRITFVNIASRRQETVECKCSGVAFNGQDQLITADGNVLAIYEPATASRLRGVSVHPPDGGQFLSMSVKAASGDTTVVRGQDTSANSGAFAVGPDGRAVLIGRGADPGVQLVAMSDDGRWVAWGMLGVCGLPTQIGVTDLTQPSKPASIQGPLEEGQALDARFDGDNLIVGWAPMNHEDGGCGYPVWEPQQWQTRRPQLGTGSFDNPVPVRWTKRSDQRRILRTAPSGALLYTQVMPPANTYSLWLGPAPGGGSDLDLSPDVMDVVARPVG